MNSIMNLLPSDALVTRDGQSTKINSTDLVVGDIVKISIGNKTPADMRILSTSGVSILANSHFEILLIYCYQDLRFDRSMLTGESEEIDGAVECTEKNFLESRNIALMVCDVTCHVLSSLN